ncbi:MAG TPA: hypothetical protein VHM31_09500 [Polyangia bacterium]|nr:hypothetical protein [Polyangia bacterium]
MNRAFTALVLPLAGCSLMFVQPPHEGYGYRGVVGCTKNRLAPFIDTVFTATNVASAVYVASQDNVTNKGGAVAVGLAAAGAWAASAAYGYYNTNRCAELLADAEDDDRPFRRHPNNGPFGWRAPVAPMPPAGAPPATAPAAAAPPSAVPQQPHEDNPAARRPPGPDRVAPRFGE